MIDVGTIIKLARTSLGYSVNSLASKAKVSNGAIVSYENGSTVPNIVNLVKLAKTLQIPLEDFEIKFTKINIVKDDIKYLFKYNKDNEIYYYGICNKCGVELFVNEIDFNNTLRTKCRKCTAKELNEDGRYSLTDIDIERLDTIFQNNIVKRSVKLGVDCTLTLHDYLHLITQNCYYCNEVPTQVDIINEKKFLHNGIDRLDSTKGYTKENSVSCCTKCNMAKGSLTEKDFLDLVNRIYENKRK